MSTDASNLAPASVEKLRQRATAASHCAPRGARGLPFRYAKVVSSGAIMPARAPASMDMLHTVMRCSIESARMLEPRYSITCPVPPDTPTRPMIARIRSLAVTPAGSSPSTLTAKVFGLRCSRHCVASTWPTSVLPMPKARAPNAPWVLVWLSPQTIVMPGSVAPSSGPITCTMPRRASRMPNSSTPNSAQLRSSWSTCLAAASSVIGTAPNTCSVRVGVEWSMVASVRSGRRTGRPSDFNALNACGEVTSWMRCRSTYSTAGVSGVSGSTSCAAQTFSNSVRAAMSARSGSAGFQPGHARAQLRADFFDRMVEVGLQQPGVFAPPALRFRDPLARELALLNFGEDLLHLPLGRPVHHARAARQIAVLGGIADEAVHLADAALVQQVDDQLEFMQALVVGDRRLIARFDQRFVAFDDELGGAAAQHRLFAEQIGFRLLGEGGLQHAAT